MHPSCSTGGFKGCREGCCWGSRWGWAPSVLELSRPPAPGPSGHPALSSWYNGERASIERHVPCPEKPSPNPPLSGPPQSSKPPLLMPCCCLLSPLGSESPLRGKKSSPKALQSVPHATKHKSQAFPQAVIHSDANPFAAGDSRDMPMPQGQQQEQSPSPEPLSKGWLPAPAHRLKALISLMSTCLVCLA